MKVSSKPTAWLFISLAAQLKRAVLNHDPFDWLISFMWPDSPVLPKKPLPRLRPQNLRSPCSPWILLQLCLLFLKIYVLFYVNLNMVRSKDWGLAEDVQGLQDYSLQQPFLWHGTVLVIIPKSDRMCMGHFGSLFCFVALSIFTPASSCLKYYIFKVFWNRYYKLSDFTLPILKYLAYITVDAILYCLWHVW